MDRCPHCSSTDLEARLAAPGSPHYAALHCKACGRHLKWLPRPAEPGGGPSPEVMAMVRPRVHPAILIGTEKQCFRARQIQAKAIHSFGKRGRPEIVALLKSITSASWFLANSGKRLEGIRWPSPKQCVPTHLLPGHCKVCGSETFGTELCSYICKDIDIEKYLNEKS